MDKISLLGCGTWGSAVAQVLADKGLTVTAWQRNEEKAEKMARTRKHPNLTDLVFNENIVFTSDLNVTLKSADIIILATPSHSIRELIPRVGFGMKAQSIIVNLAKGIDLNTLMTMSQLIQVESNIDSDQIVSLYGPSHAEEVVRKLPTTLVAACPKNTTSKTIQELLSTEVLRVYRNKDILGVEIGGSLKNVMAIAAGICDGIGYGDNSKAAILTRGITEMTRLGLVMGAKKSTFSGLSGIGDLLVTALSKHSRNRYVGEEIGRGRSLRDITDNMDMIAEGINTCRAIPRIIEKYNIEMPIANSVYGILFDNKNPLEAVKELMTRNLTAEKR
jgi:glycerol-3-phosphate dehydrogenase (NAD(P)+)